jgi:C-terminal peptidase prc
MIIKFTKWFYFLIFLKILFIPASFYAQRDIPLGLKRERGLEMLAAVKKELKDNYYDPNFHGLDIEKNYELARTLIKQATASGQVNMVIASFLLDLNDSHTFFIPDERIGFPDYGFSVQMIDKTCFITSVKKDSDADKKGLKAGDLIYSFDRLEPSRESLWKINYLYNTLDPKAQISLVLQNLDKTLREVVINTKLVKWEDYEREMEKRKYKIKYSPFECKAIESETSICRLKTFDASTGDIDKMMKTVKDSKNFILDLRQNSGGLVDTTKHLLGYFFEKDILIGTEKKRKASKEIFAKTQKNKVFSGKLSVLVDSNSASASEVFARVIQLEKRGNVIGDRSAGAVMESIQIVKTLIPRVALQTYTTVPYAVNVTIADLMMEDGKSLENVGVNPDFFIVPSGSDLSLNRDVVLAKAASLLEIKLDSNSAGKLFQKSIYDEEN